MVEIAYIDDNRDCLEIIQSAFDALDIKIDIYDDAIQFYNFNKEYKVVISDFEMPGLNGQDFITILKEKFPKIKTVIYSGVVDAIPNKNLSIDAFLAKPMEFDSLLKSVRFLLYAYDNENKQEEAS